MTALRRSLVASMGLWLLACAAPPPDGRYPLGFACGDKPATFEQAIALLEQKSGGNSWSDERCDIGYPAAVHAYASELELCWNGAPLFDEMVKAGVNGQRAMIETVAVGWYRKRHGQPFDLASTLDAERRARATWDACVAGLPPSACSAGAVCPASEGLASCFERSQQVRDPGWSRNSCGAVPAPVPRDPP